MSHKENMTVYNIQSIILDEKTQMIAFKECTTSGWTIQLTSEMYHLLEKLVNGD